MSVLVVLSVLPLAGRAASLLFVSDTISTSHPGIGADHTIRFKTVSLVPVSGKIVITPEAGFFTVPSGLDYTDIDLLIFGVQNSLGPTPSISQSGVTVEGGVAPRIVITLSSNTFIPPASDIIVKIGKNAAHEAIGDQQIINPSVVGSYKIAVETRNSLDASLDTAFGMIAITSPVSVETSQPLAPVQEAVISAGGGGGGAIAPPPFPQEVTTGIGVVVINSVLKGSAILRNVDGSSASIFLDAGSVAQSAEIRITPLGKNTVLSASPAPLGFDVIGSIVYSLSAQAGGTYISEFLKPAILTFSYTDANIEGFREETLKVYRWVAAAKQWSQVTPSSIDPAKNMIVAQTNRLSLFAIMGERRSRAQRPGDFNNDGKVDLVDFSILLYNWGAPKNPAADINQDGKVDLVDFSIFLYWWTG